MYIWNDSGQKISSLPRSSSKTSTIKKAAANWVHLCLLYTKYSFLLSKTINDCKYLGTHQDYLKRYLVKASLCTQTITVIKVVVPSH